MGHRCRNAVLVAPLLENLVQLPPVVGVAAILSPELLDILLLHAGEQLLQLIIIILPRPGPQGHPEPAQDIGSPALMRQFDDPGHVLHVILQEGQNRRHRDPGEDAVVGQGPHGLETI